VRHAVDLQAAGIPANSVWMITEALGINQGRIAHMLV
jgi:hypothetical protein